MGSVVSLRPARPHTGGYGSARRVFRGLRFEPEVVTDLLVVTSHLFLGALCSFVSSSRRHCSHGAERPKSCSGVGRCDKITAMALALVEAGDTAGPRPLWAGSEARLRP